MLSSRWELLVVLAMLLTGLSPGGAQTVGEFHARADEALQSFLLKFWDGGQQYLRHWYPSDGSLTGYWTYAQGWEAVLDGAERTGGRQYHGLIESLYLGQEARGWFSGFFDDECWMVMALIRAYDLTGESKYLAQAQPIFADIMTAWDSTCCGSVKGGLWWDKARTQKATAANAGAALAGARLYQRTSSAVYLTFAQQVYSFWYGTMVSPTTGQVCDHINPDGTKVWWRFTYNEGLMIGASIELYQATGSAGYLANAHKIANYLVTQEVYPTVYGPVLYDGNNDGCGGDCHQFKGAAYRYLSRLYSLDPSKTQYYAVLRASANAIWNLARETDDTIFSVHWAGPPQTSGDVAQNSAACMALNLFASLAGPYPGPGLPANQYEAEDATSHRIQLETLYGSYTGWGYLAGWNGNNRWVDFQVRCATAGPHELVFRYAAGAGSASRVIKVNGNVLDQNRVFPGTGDWTRYNTVTIPCNLPEGSSTVSVLFDSTQGSGNWLNLDHLRVTGDAPEQIRIDSFTVSDGGVIQLSWNTRFGQTYQVQFKSALGDGEWTDLGEPLFAVGECLTVTDAVAGNEARYYRVVGL